jgi:hypothetical protein
MKGQSASAGWLSRGCGPGWIGSLRDAIRHGRESAIVAAATASLTGEAGGFLNVTRACGVSVGVAAASSLLAWRLAALTGSGHNTLHAGAHELITAGRDVIVLLAGFAAIAGAISLAQRNGKRP